MDKKIPPGRSPGRRKYYPRGGTSAGHRSRALRGPSGLTDEQERQTTDLLKRMAGALFGPAGPASDDDRSTLYRRVAEIMQGEPECQATPEQVRIVAQRIRTRREIRLGYPVSLRPDDYAYVASLREEAGGTLMGALGAIIRAHRIKAHRGGG
jgi:hypothetical protein